MATSCDSSPRMTQSASEFGFALTASWSLAIAS